MMYKKTNKVSLKEGGGKLGKVSLKKKECRLKTGPQMGDDARKGLDMRPMKVR